MEKGFEREVLDRLKTIEVKIDDYNKTKDKAEEAHNQSLQNKDDIKEIKEKMQWITRTIAGSIILTVMGAIIFVIKMM